MPPRMKDNKWYRIDVPVPPDLTGPQAERLIEDLAAGLARADHRMKGLGHTAYVNRPKQDPQDDPAGAPSAVIQPLYFCHNKF